MGSGRGCGTGLEAHRVQKTASRSGMSSLRGPKARLRPAAPPAPGVGDTGGACLFVVGRAPFVRMRLLRTSNCRCRKRLIQHRPPWRQTMNRGRSNWFDKGDEPTLCAHSYWLHDMGDKQRKQLAERTCCRDRNGSRLAGSHLCI